MPLVERGEEILRESTLFDLAQRHRADTDYSSRRDISKGMHGAEPHIRIVGCTISDGDAKARNDAAKGQALALRLATRFQDAVLKTVLIGSGMHAVKEEHICDEYIDAKEIGLAADADSFISERLNGT